VPQSLPTRRLTLAGLFAVATGAAAGASMAADADGWPLWVIKANGGTVYLTGETPGGLANWRDARIEGLAYTCGALWTEAGTAARGPIGPLLVRYGFDAKNPLMTRLGAHDKSRVVQAAGLAHVSLEQLGTARPWLAAYQLEHAYRRVLGLTGLSANEVLTADAKTAGVPISSEFPAQDDTIVEYGSMAPDQDLQFLRYTLDDILAPPEEATRENADWARGDLARATASAIRFKQRYPELARSFFVERNRRWLPRIGAMLQQPKPSLVVVGNYHLLGPDGVLALLKAQGRAAERL
jgi:uncharacterized protein YbaP (TraB family)